MPLLAGLAIPFFVFAAAIVLVGIAQTHTAAHGSQNTAGFWDYLSSGLLKQLFGIASKAASFVASHFAASQLRLLALWLKDLGTLTIGWFGVSALFAEAVTDALGRIERRGDPQARRKAAKALGAAGAAGAAARHGLHLGRANQKNLSTYKAHTNPQLRTLHHQTTAVLPREIGRVGRREEALSRDQAKLKERTKSLEDGAEETWNWIRTHPLSGVTGVFTGAVAIALARMGFGFLRCRNWQKVGKSLTCGMGAWVLRLLETIAGFGLATLAVTDPEALAKAAVAAVDTVEPIIGEILRR